jgi:hypothetical protein
MTYEYVGPACEQFGLFLARHLNCAHCHRAFTPKPKPSTHSATPIPPSRLDWLAERCDIGAPRFRVYGRDRRNTVHSMFHPLS